MSRQSSDTSYASLFRAYTERTDGKTLLARALISCANETKSLRLLDCGAGDGVLTERLGTVFEHVEAIEKNRDFYGLLQDIPRCKPVLGRIEDHEPAYGLDMVLLSYSMTGIPPYRLGSFLTMIRSKLSQRGKLLLCTFDDDSLWAQFARLVHGMFGTGLRGGVEDHRNLLALSGYEADVIHHIETCIWGETVEVLAETLQFFFLKHRELYMSNLHVISQHLRRHSRRNEKLNRWELDVRECILEVRFRSYSTQ